MTCLRRILGVAPLLLVFLAVGAWAYWSAAGHGTATASVGTINAPTNVAGTPSGSTVGVSWTASATGAAAIAPSGYYVIRTRTSDNSTSAACGSSATTLLHTTSCNDTSVADGTYAYKVVAKLNSWTATSAASGSVTVNAVTTSATVASSANPGKVGQAITYTATVAASPSGAPAGNVKFLEDGVAVTGCTAQPLSAGSPYQATCTRTYSSTGTRSVTAQYLGNATYPASTSTALSQAVDKGDQTIGFTSTPVNPQNGGATYTVSASATSGLAVTFASATTPVCTISGSTVTFVAAGTCTLSANQAGDGNWNAAPQATQTFTVAKGDQTITFAALADRRFDESPVSVSGSASSGLVVSYSSTTTSVCTSGGDANGATITFVATGTCTIKADQAGNSNYNAASSVTHSFTVTPGNQTITFNPLADQRFDQSPLAVSGTASSGLTVSFSSTTTSVCTAGGTNGATITFVATGTCTVKADQAGNGDYNAASSVSRSFTVTKANQTITFGTIANRRLDQSPFTPSPLSASSGLTPSLSSSTTTVCTASGTTVTLLKAGTCTLSADQPGNSNYNAASTVSQTFTVNKGNQTISFNTIPSTRLDQSPVTVSATASSGLTVAFTSATTSTCTVSGTSVTLLHTGTCTINANQAGNTDWNAATQVPQSFTITKKNQTVTFGTAPAFARTGVSGSSVTATATSGLSPAFGTSTSGICTVNGTSGALSLLSIGTCTITGDQAGDADWAAAPQATQSFPVYNGATAGLIFTNVKVNGSTVTPACTGTVGTTWTCPTSGGNNAAVTANVAFGASNGTTANIFSTLDQTINWTQTGKNAGSGSVTITGATSTSATTVAATKSGNNSAQVTATVTLPNGGTWTAVLTIT